MGHKWNLVWVNFLQSIISHTLSTTFRWKVSLLFLFYLEHVTQPCSPAIVIRIDNFVLKCWDQPHKRMSHKHEWESILHKIKFLCSTVFSHGMHAENGFHCLMFTSRSWKGLQGIVVSREHQRTTLDPITPHYTTSSHTTSNYSSRNHVTSQYTTFSYTITQHSTLLTPISWCYTPNHTIPHCTTLYVITPNYTTSSHTTCNYASSNH